MPFARRLRYDSGMTRAWVFALVFAAACGNAPSDDDCKKFLNHLVDLEFKKAGAAATTDAMKSEISKQKDTVTQAKSAEFIDVCKKKMSKARVKCALAATELDGEAGVGKCDEAK
jgi:hypothetical protein